MKSVDYQLGYKEAINDVKHKLNELLVSTEDAFKGGFISLSVKDSYTQAVKDLLEYYSNQ